MNDTYINIDGSNSMTSDLNLDSNNIINVSDPVNNQDASTKYYTDNLITSSLSGINPLFTESSTIFIWSDTILFLSRNTL